MKGSVLFFKHIKALLCKLLLGCLFLYGCNNSDSIEELSGDYFYHDEGEHIKDILSHLPNGKSIYSEILDYDYNTQFIVAVQHPIYDQYKNMLGFELRNNLQKYPTNSIEERIQSEKEADSILRNDPYYKSIFVHKINYWIIAHKSKKIFGPLTKEEYARKREELNVPKTLKLKTE